MDLGDNFTIIIEPNPSIRNAEKQRREWCGSLVGAIVWLSSILPDTSYVFRGHPNADWNLESSLKRLRKPSTSKQLEAAEAQILKDVSRDFWFRREFSFDSAPDSKHRDYERTIALLQHHGIPTRLLDVTADPLVALYFAVIGEHRADDMDETEGAVIFIRAFTEDEKLPVHIIPAPQISQRVTAQRSKFIAPNSSGESKDAAATTVAFDFSNVNIANGSHTDFDNLIENYLTGEFSGRPPAKAPNLLTFKIPGDMKPACRQILRSLGVSAGTLFPGSEGFRKALAGF